MSAEAQVWSEVGTIDDIPRRGTRRLHHAAHPIALFRTYDDRVFALVDRCPHAGGPLSEGIVHDGCVTCPLHGWVISLESGTAQGADHGATRTLPVRIEERAVLVRLDLLADGATP